MDAWLVDGRRNIMATKTKKQKRYVVTVEASNRVVYQSDSLVSILRRLRRAQGRVCIDDTKTNREIACGTPSHVRGVVAFKIDPYRG
jgi:capsule polysaccharide modification protein KpsS